LAREARALEGDALVELVNLGWRAGHPLDEVRGYFEAARERFEKSGDRRSLTLLHSNYSLVFGLDCPTSVTSYREANRLARELDDTALQVVVGVGIEPLIMAGQLREALDWADGCVELLEGQGPSGPALLHYDPRAWIHSGRAHARVLLGDVAGAVVDSDRGLALARECTDFDRRVALMIRTSLESLRGNTETALEHARRQMEITEKIGGTSNLAHTATSLGSALVRAGLPEEAIPWLREAQRLRGRVICGSVRGLASALLETGEPEQAFAVVQQDVVEASAQGVQTVELELQIERAEVAARTGHEAEARAALARARELAENTECKILTPAIHEAAAVLAESLGDAQQQRTERREALRLYQELGATGHADRLAEALR
jgi:tetratricopeptide (TPR) repeat protein